MAEDGRRDNHFGVITAFENFQVRAASQGRLDSNAHLSHFERRGGDFLDANIFFAIKNSGFHPPCLWSENAFGGRRF